MVENIKALTGTVTPGLKKGVMSTGTIVSIARGTANEFMKPEQVEMRKVLSDAPFIMIEICEEESGKIIEKTFPDYGDTPPENSIHGKMVDMYDDQLCENGVVNLITREVGREGNTFNVWDVVL